MSIKAKEYLAAAATALAVIGLLAAMQFSAAPAYIKKDSGIMTDEGRHTKHSIIMIDDCRLVEYQ